MVLENFHSVRSEYGINTLMELYVDFPSLFTLKLHHGGVFTKPPGIQYVNGFESLYDGVDSFNFNVKKLEAELEKLGYDLSKKMYYHFLIPERSLENGLHSFGNDEDINEIRSYVVTHKEISMYVEHDVDVLGSSQVSCVEQDHSDEGQVKTKQMYSSIDEEDDSADEDYIVDEDNSFEEGIKDMSDFHFSVDKDVEFMGNASQKAPEVVKTDIPIVVDELSNDDFDSDQDGGDADERIRKKKVQEARVLQEKAVEDVSYSYFYVGQEFGSRDEVKDLVKKHAVETRRQLVFIKNEPQKLQVQCAGECDEDEVVEKGECSKQVVVKNKNNIAEKVVENDDKKKSWRKRNLNIECEWRLYVSKPVNKETWKVQTYKPFHKCHTSRNVKQCTYEFSATHLVHQIPSNPKIPTGAVKTQYEQQFQMEISKTKAYRALKAAKKVVQGDYQKQYAEIRDYLEELKRSNPGTTVKVLNEPCPEDEPTRIFKRCYVCLGPLKEGFKTLSRDLLGLDGVFMKEPAYGQILSAVGVDSNNGIYPLAYAMVEGENYNSWSWFLKCLAEDLDLTTMSNFTFISDRQKGLINAVERIFPCAEHRFCLRHLHENMKSRWRGLAYKQHLWKCATATTVPHFEKYMLDLKRFDESAWKYLADIPPQTWSRSHFTGRAVSDVLLSNMCEVFNRWIVDGRDKPIITCLEFIREYLMKRIDTVRKKIMKSEGLLTPKATKVFEDIKKEAGKYTVSYNGSRMFQVNGPHNDQMVVDMGQKTCACRKWELTGMPCKHAIACIRNMRANDPKLPRPEGWVHQVHHLKRWSDTYEHCISPLNGREMWPKSNVQIPILPPLKIATAGRPKKNRRKGLHENDDLVSGGKLSKKGQIIKCGICKGEGHNRRGCPTRNVQTGEASGSKKKSKNK